MTEAEKVDWILENQHWLSGLATFTKEYLMTKSPSYIDDVYRDIIKAKTK